MTDVVKIGRKGQIALPRRVRAELRLEEGDELLVTIEEEAIVLRRKAQGLGGYLESLRRGPAPRKPT